MGDFEGLQKNQTGNGKRKPRRFSFVCLTFANRANGSLSFLHLLKKQMEDIRLQMVKKDLPFTYINNTRTRDDIKKGKRTRSKIFTWWKITAERFLGLIDKSWKDHPFRQDMYHQKRHRNRGRAAWS